MNQIRLYKDGMDLYLKSDLLHDDKGIFYHRLEKDITFDEIVFIEGGRRVTNTHDVMGEIYKGFYWTSDVRLLELDKLNKMITNLYVEQIKVTYEYDKEYCISIFGEELVKRIVKDFHTVEETHTVEDLHTENNKHTLHTVEETHTVEDLHTEQNLHKEDTVEELHKDNIVENQHIIIGRNKTEWRKLGVDTRTLGGNKYIERDGIYFSKDEIIDYVLNNNLIKLQR